MKVLQAVQAREHRSRRALPRSGRSCSEESETIERRDIGHRFSVRLWLTQQQIALAEERPFLDSRAVSSPVGGFPPVRGRWAYLTREEKSCASWANGGLAVSLLTGRSQSGN